VRANSIFRKLGELEIAAVQPLIQERKEAVNNVFSSTDGDEIWSLLMLSARLEDANAQAAAGAEPAVLAKYTFNLAKSFNLFYHRHKIIAEADAIKRSVLIAVANHTRRQLTAALATLGIAVPQRM